MPFLGAYEEHHGAEGDRAHRPHAGGAGLRAAASAARRRACGAAVGGDRGPRPTPRPCSRRPPAGDPLAGEIVEESLQGAGRAIVTMALVLNPELVVIGGGVAHAGDVVIEPLRRRLEQMVRLPPRLEASPLAERGVVLGAIRHALDDVEPRALDGLHEAA